MREAMKSVDIVAHMASDFAAYLNDAFGSNDPADEYFDPIYAVFGKAPTRESILATYNSTAGIAKLSEKLKSWCENNDLSEKLAKEMLRRAIINSFGRDAVT